MLEQTEACENFQERSESQNKFGCRETSLHLLFGLSLVTMEPLLGQFVKDCVPPTLYQAVTWLTLETLQADSPLFPMENGLSFW